MAIAFDATSNGGTGSPGTSLTVSHTCTGIERLLIVGVDWQSTSALPTITYAGVSMTGSSDNPAFDNHANGVRALIYSLVGPASGANNIVVTGTFSGAGQSCLISNASYTGVNQSGFLDGHSKTENTSVSTSTVLTVTTAIPNSWLFGFFRNEIGGAADGANTTSRHNAGDHALADSGGGRAVGSNSLTQTFASAVNAGVVVAFSPSGGSFHNSQPYITVGGGMSRSERAT